MHRPAKKRKSKFQVQELNWPQVHRTRASNRFVFVSVSVFEFVPSSGSPIGRLHSSSSSSALRGHFLLSPVPLESRARQQVGSPKSARQRTRRRAACDQTSERAGRAQSERRFYLAIAVFDSLPDLRAERVEAEKLARERAPPRNGSVESPADDWRSDLI